MVLLAGLQADDTTPYLKSTDIPTLLEAAIEAIEFERQRRVIKHPLRFIGQFLKDNLQRLKAEQREALAAEAEAIAHAVDADGDGNVSIDELRAHMRQRGLADAQVSALFAALDENADGKLSRDELAAGLRRARTGEPALKELMAAVEPPEGVDFADLATAPGGCFNIADTARRAINLEQMERILRHVARRMGCELVVKTNGYKGIKLKATWKKAHNSGERWLGSRPRAGRFVHVPISFADVNLYDNARYVIGAATAAMQCSMVELMVSEEQPPDYFVSHFWAEPILDFFNCLLEHAWARGLEQEGMCYHNGQYMDDGHPQYLGGRSPSNQHKLSGELVLDLEQTSFARALRLAKGALSVVDASGGCFGRIWCVFELFKSLVGSSEGYTYDLVTATEWKEGSIEHGAVAITDGLSAQQPNAECKLTHERAFPLPLIEKGVSFESAKGQASVEKDRERILGAIGADSALLDAKVHGVVALAAMRRALEEVGLRSTIVEAVRLGHARKLQLSLVDSKEDTAETWQEVVGALDAEATVELSMRTGLEVFPVASFGRLAALRSIDMSGCQKLASLPEGLFGGLASLTSIQMSRCEGLASLPAGLFGGLASLTLIQMSGCVGFTSLPEGLFGGLASLTSIDMSLCVGLASLPEGLFGGLASLTSINVSTCIGLPSLPAGLFGGLASLTSIDMSFCEGLTSLPEGLFGGLASLTSINMSLCVGLASLPEGLFGGLASLKKIDMSDCNKLKLEPGVMQALKANGVEVIGK